MDMIEKVEQAIKAEMNNRHSDGCYHVDKMARAAIEAMREPSVAMRSATRWPGKTTWQAMITAALAPSNLRK